MLRRVKFAFSVCLFGLCASACHGFKQPASVQQAKAEVGQINIGESFAIDSKVLSEPRNINVYLPMGYHKSDAKFPVLYLIDGGLDQDFLHIAGTVQLGALWARSRSAIIVGIETKDRRRELTGKTSDVELLKRYPTAGSSSLFRAFIRDEVIPAVDKKYRVSSERAVIGESLAGLFIVETYLRDPKIFTQYAAISPSLWWDNGKLAADAKRLVAEQPDNNAPLYLTLANEGKETEAGMGAIINALRGKQGYCYSPKLDATHATIYHSVSPEALQFLFPHPEKSDPQSGFTLKCQGMNSGI